MFHCKVSIIPSAMNDSCVDYISFVEKVSFIRILTHLKIDHWKQVRYRTFKLYKIFSGLPCRYKAYQSIYFLSLQACTICKVNLTGIQIRPQIRDRREIKTNQHTSQMRFGLSMFKDVLFPHDLCHVIVDNYFLMASQINVNRIYL